MCTLSWNLDASGYDLLFNRDESRSRARGLPPRVTEVAGCRVVAPGDADHGGTWISANEHGVTLCLLNHYEADALRDARARSATRSRGLLVRDLAACSSIDDVVRGVGVEEAKRHRPFLLVVFAPGETPIVLRFDGESLERRALTDDDQPVVSSGFDSGRVARGRRDTFRARLGESADPRDDLDRRLALHGSHVPERGPYSICMHRPDAETVSLSRVRVEAGRVRFWYCPEAPCRASFGSPIEIARRAIPDAGAASR